MNTRPVISAGLVCLLIVVATACAAEGAIPTQPPQPPDEYLSNALDWIETHSVKIEEVDWATIRKEALALAPDPQTTTDTYPAILFVMEKLGDSVTFFLPPEEVNATSPDVGITAFYPEAIIMEVRHNGPADHAGLRVGDVIESINGKPPEQWQGTQFLEWYTDMTIQMKVRRAGQDQPIEVTLTKVKSPPQQATPSGRRISTDQGNVGYMELPVESGAGQLYPTLAQQVIREADQLGTCGWIIDLRRNSGGDIWSYIAAIGPILGEGEVGGFVFLDGRSEPWKYDDRKVFWGKEERFESLVEGSIYRLKHAMPPVALLTSRATMAAGELAVVTFQGRVNVHIFGEPTGGTPFLSYWTGLSDGAWVGVSGAFSIDRTGRIYDGSIIPDEPVKIDWTLFGTERDPVILAATKWLLNQPDCAH